MFEAKNRTRPAATLGSVLAGGLLLLCAAFPAAATTELGRLFFSPLERSALDRARTSPIECLSVSGLIIRDGKQRGAWMGSGLDVSRLRPTVVASNDPHAAFEVHIESEKTVTLRPGRSLDMIDGGIYDAFDTNRGHCVDSR